MTNDATTWRSLAEALAVPGATGVGFQMLGVKELAGIDIDGCYDHTTGAASPLARSLLDALPATYAEVTPSGKGLRIFASIPAGQRVPEFLSRAHGVECYVGKSARYLTLTGLVLPGRERLLADLTPAGLKLLKQFSDSKDAENIDLEVTLPVPAGERVADWKKKLFDARLPYSRLTKEHRQYMEEGDIAGARSEKSFSIALRLLEARYLPDEVYYILYSAQGPWEAALDKREQDPERARALIWSDIARAQKLIRAEDHDLQTRLDAWQSIGLRLDRHGKRITVVQNQANACRMLLELPEWRGRLALDVTSGEVLLDNAPLTDNEFFLLQERLTMFAGWTPNSHRQWWGDVVRSVGGQNPRNPRASYLRSLTWDGVSRLDSFAEHVAADPTPLDRLLLRKWLISLAARWIDPGCKCDSVLVLQGPEGTYKTTFFETMAGGAERVAYLDGFERDDRMVMARAWIVEVPEAHLFKRADRNRLKGFITKPVDEYRPPYAAQPVVVKRGAVLVSTCNQGDLFTADQDGLRRFWLVDVDGIDLDWIRDHREQVLAEAVVAYDVGEEWWFDTTPAELASRVQMVVETSAIDEALDVVVKRRKGQGGTGLTEILSEVSALLGYRPLERAVLPLLWKHGLRKRRSMHGRYWIHPTWGKDGEKGADVLPLPPADKILA